MADALNEKPLFMPGVPTTAIEYGQIRRIQKQQMERLTADPAEEKAAEAYTVQAVCASPARLSSSSTP